MGAVRRAASARARSARGKKTVKMIGTISNQQVAPCHRARDRSAAPDLKSLSETVVNARAHRDMVAVVDHLPVMRDLDRPTVAVDRRPGTVDLAEKIPRGNVVQRRILRGLTRPRCAASLREVHSDHTVACWYRCRQRSLARNRDSSRCRASRTCRSASNCQSFRGKRAVDLELVAVPGSSPGRSWASWYASLRSYAQGVGGYLVVADAAARSTDSTTAALTTHVPSIRESRCARKLPA
jgi:hypothetical protein